MAKGDYVVYVIAALFFAGWIFMWSVHVVAIVYGKWRLYRRAPPLVLESGLPGVSIMKPLVGVDSNLFSNLETFFNMNYPKVQANIKHVMNIEKYIVQTNNNMNKYYMANGILYFTVYDRNHNDINTISQYTLDCEFICNRIPNVQIVGGKLAGVNPKINNMMPAYEAAKYELVMVSDSGLRMKEDTLTDMVNTMTDRVGMVHQMPYTCDRTTFPATLEKNVVKALLERLPPPKSDSAWTKLRIAMLPLLIFFEPMSECVVMGIAGSLSIMHLFDWSFLVCYLVHVLIWFLLDYILLKTTQNGALPFGKVDYIVAWLMRELSVVPIFVQALFEPTISWRTGAQVRLRWGGVAEECSGVKK
ncbi:PREDICTED: ceramide glucosyltransferase-like [Priapulus caudatus]|uniref:Ceramide glucosyltransferase-like n=1 Tax=Priapulus caudatus TaxID=37621 RepID=A0ABM1DZC5_PRICU|nr:PREDICTED: ceramide glucosyltransferase-like [Priapulus caudatus]